MAFISLDEVLKNIAEHVQVLEKPSDDFPFPKISEAADHFHANLINFDETAPKWYDKTDTKHPRLSTIAKDQGLEILAHTLGVHKREIKRHTNHLIACEKAGISPDKYPAGSSLDNMIYPRKLYMKPKVIGFDCDELIAFLNEHKIEHSLTSDKNLPSQTLDNKNTQEKKQGRREQQINFIIETAQTLNYELLAVPEGGKKAIKAECLKNKSLFTADGFDHAWQKASTEKIISIKDKEKYL